MKGVYYSSKVTKSVFVDYGSLSPEYQRLYEKSRDYVSSQHPHKVGLWKTLYRIT